MTAGRTGLDPFDTVGLAELVETAALLTRVDRKYVVRRSNLDKVLGALRAQVPDARVLEEDGARAFAYESVYFDTPDLASYLAASRKRRRRFKVRTRAYLDSGDCYLEVKTRGGRSTTVKDRLGYDIAARDTLTTEGRRYADEVLGEAGIGAIAGQELDPVLATRYERSTMLLPSGSRATIDLDLEWELDGGDLLRLPDLAIVESKSGTTPSELDRLLWRSGTRPVGISKYSVGLAALRPELPANKWSRVLRRHFPAPPSAPPRLSVAAGLSAA